MQHLHKEIGWTQPNGATCLTATWFDNPEYGVGLFIWPESPDPFVTWSMVRQGDSYRKCHTGHYFMSLTKAIEDYKERGGSIT